MLGDRIGKVLFKLAVEVSILSRIIAAGTEISLPTLDKLRVQCVHDVERTHGMISFKDALLFQDEA